MSPSVTSSPVIGSFPDNVKLGGRNSPAPPSAPRPASSRGRQNSTTQPNTEASKPRQPLPTASKPNGVSVVLPELAPPPPNGARAAPEKAKEPIAPPPPPPPKQDTAKTEPENMATAGSITASGNKKESSAKIDEIRPKKEPTPSSTPIMQTITTKSGRASKPSTPALATFAEAQARAASRPSRATEPTIKRSHKKGGSAAAAAALAARRAEDAANGRQPDDEEEDPLYCYCNGVSYGEMIACDADDCAKEWFHLECVGLKVAPKGNGKFKLAPISIPHRIFSASRC